MRRVDINGRFLTQVTTGVQRYAAELIRALDRRLGADGALRRSYQFRVITPRGASRALSLEHIPIVEAGRLAGNPWEQLELPMHAGGQLLLNLCNTAPLIGENVVTIHDASVFVVPKAYSASFRLWYRALIPVLGRLARRVVTLSAFSRAELSRHAGILPEKTDIIPPGGDHILRVPADPGVFARVPAAPQRYILAVGSRSPHKNIESVVKAVSRLGAAALPLVVAGGTNSRIFGEAAPSGAHYHDAGYVTDGELRALYENAACLVFPSWYEGFGLPPLEAMTCGCPVVVSNRAALPEVGGDAVLYCNPYDPDDIARCIAGILGEPGRRDRLRHEGSARARCFTWEKSAGALIKLLEELQPA
jgi:glycosyltransferase involved in cell wall biosynthesis